jgi:uncharacterized phiE125 gp8 family phage protein
MQLKLITAPSAEPVALSDAKAQCFIDPSDTSRDAVLTGYIAAARQLVENETGLALMPQTWELQLPYFPLPCRNDYYGIIRVPKLPFQSVVSMTYTDTNGNAQTLTENTDFEVHFDQTSRSCVLPPYNKFWPTTRYYPGSVKFRYVAGYADAASVPQAIKQAILLIVGSFNENREGDVILSAIPNNIIFGVDRLLKDYKDVTFGAY